ncbi:MAG: riboflavin synthase [Deltaproteobacteria bacterium]|nr:riboflavin synthase [Deltaproteobacteria bacterium]
MFSGIIEESAKVVSVARVSGGGRLELLSALDHSGTKVGDSISVSGVCLTVCSLRGKQIVFDISEETLRRSSLGSLRAGDAVNLERSLVLGGRIHGHLVFGHVDTVVSLITREEEGNSLKLVWSLPDEWQPYLVPKGSVALAGVSLTVGEVMPGRFAVYLIPHTLKVTTLLSLRPGDVANLEVDMLARYVGSMIASKQTPSAVDESLLREHGFIRD